MSEKEKTPGQLLQEKLLRSPKNGGLTLSEEQVAEAYDYCENYKEFISTCKTEREFIDWCIPMLEKEGFVPFEPGHKYVAGDKIYINNRNKAFLFAKIGRRPFEEGLHIAAAHIDSPRLDLKPNPLYEDKELALFKTHYYGGIKRYQWTTIPLALHGVVVRKDGTSVTVNVGEDENDPVFCVTDLLPHLAKEQMDRKLGDGSGLIYGMGHAVYTLSDPRAVILRRYADEFSQKKGREDEFKLLSLIEQLTPELFAKHRGDKKKICANVDLYSGLIYDMLGIPQDLFTPIFMAARTAGWSAHRIEEITSNGKIVRPAYKNVTIPRAYVPMSDRIQRTEGIQKEYIPIEER